MRRLPSPPAPTVPPLARLQGGAASRAPTPSGRQELASTPALDPHRHISHAQPAMPHSDALVRCPRRTSGRTTMRSDAYRSVAARSPLARCTRPSRARLLPPVAPLRFGQRPARTSRGGSCRERPPGLPHFVRHAFALLVPLLVPTFGRGSLPAELTRSGGSIRASSTRTGTNCGTRAGLHWTLRSLHYARSG